MAEIHKADPRALRLALWLAGGGSFLGIALIGLGIAHQPDLEAWVEQDVGTRLRVVIVAAMVLTAGPLLGMAVYLWRLGGRVVRAERFPAPQARVIRDTAIITGQAARRRGQVLQASAVAIGLAALFLAYSLWQVGKP